MGGNFAFLFQMTTRTLTCVWGYRGRDSVSKPMREADYLLFWHKHICGHQCFVRWWDEFHWHHLAGVYTAKWGECPEDSTKDFWVLHIYTTYPEFIQLPELPVELARNGCNMLQIQGCTEQRPDQWVALFKLGCFYWNKLLGQDFQLFPNMTRQDAVLVSLSGFILRLLWYML